MFSEAVAATWARGVTETEDYESGIELLLRLFGLTFYVLLNHFEKLFIIIKYRKKGILTF